jgi:hypothetical protein
VEPLSLRDLAGYGCKSRSDQTRTVRRQDKAKFLLSDCFCRRESFCGFIDRPLSCFLSALVSYVFLDARNGQFREGFRFLAHSRISHKLCDCRTDSSTEHHLRGIISHNCLLPHSPDLEFSATFYAASLSYVRSICNSDCQDTKFPGPLG